MSSRKGLSQILYLIIAASVLMMVAMVITFTATDVIGNAGGTATENQCTKAIQGKCAAFSSGNSVVSIPSACSRNGEFVGIAAQQPVYGSSDDIGEGAVQPSSPGDQGTSAPYYMQCGDVN